MENLIDSSASMLQQALESWKRKLVSFDGNNRQLFYKPLKLGTVDLNDELISVESLTKLIKGNKVRVSNLYFDLFEKVEKHAKNQDIHLDEDSEEESIEKENDNDVNKIWNQRLRRFESIFRRTKEDSDEKNIETCFLADGFATWKFKTASGSIPNAPFIFYPVKIESASRGNNDFNLEISGPAFFNDALVLYLQSEYGIENSLFDIDEDRINLESDEVKLIVKNLSERVPAFTVNNNKYLGNFSFSEYPMVKDIERIVEQNLGHDVLEALSGIDEKVTTLRSAGSEESIEQLSIKSPIHENLIFPVDTSQHQAISAILGGKNVVIQGPPGTGKSQTIANVIAECAANKRTVLFVAEKRAAIDAVLERLREKRLDGIVLDLHGEPDKKTIAKTLTGILKTYKIQSSLTTNDVEKYARNKRYLQKRWEWINSETELIRAGETPYRLIELLREVGLRRSEIDRSIFKDNSVYIDSIHEITSDDRDLISNHLDFLYQSDYFSKSHDHSLALKVESKLENSEQVNLFLELVGKMKNILDSNEVQNSHNQASQLISGTENTLIDVIKTFKLHQQYLDKVENWDIGQYQEILKLKNLFTSLREYKRLNNHNIFSAYFKRKKERENSVKLLSQVGRKNNINISLRSINDLEESVIAWSKLGGTLDGLYPVTPHLHELKKLIFEIEAIVDQLDLYLINIDIKHPSINEVTKIINLLYKDADFIRNMPNLKKSFLFLNSKKVTSIINFLDDNKVEREDATKIWEYLWFASHLKKILYEKNDIMINSTNLNGYINECMSKDEIVLNENPTDIIRSITNNTLIGNTPGSGFELLTKQSLLKSGHLPFRKLIEKAPQEILNIKPCFAMSPRAVSRMLPCENGMFDVVIFDEASQIKPEHAVTSIYRGKQLVVAGDRHQLPPTNFGVKNVNTDFEDVTADMESILDSVTALFPIPNNQSNVKALTRHYRSNDEKLISWSNFHIYREAGEELSSFPSTHSNPEQVLKYTYIPGVRTADMSAPNEVEIDKVVEIISQHSKDYPNKSLGVIAFGRRHATRLQDAINILEKKNKDFYEYKLSWAESREKFFVKNIETVQGDERDFIIISPGYAPNLEGNVLLRFGTLNNAGGERRLNVAASRAKDSMHLVTSLRSQEIDLSRTSARSIALFKSFLNFMERTGHLEELPEGYAVPASPFEEEIYQALTSLGLIVDCQVGESKYKIDFGIRDPETNKYVLAVEADGYSYHSSPYARERDWLRQRVLENKGWVFVRIWSTDWWENPELQIKRVLDAYNFAIKKDIRDRISDSEPVVNLQAVEKSELEQDSEFEIVRGLVAQFPYASEKDILSKWMSLIGYKRRTQNLLSRYTKYYYQAKKDIRDSRSS